MTVPEEKPKPSPQPSPAPEPLTPDLAAQLLDQVELAAESQRLTEEWNRNSVAVDTMADLLDVRGELAKLRERNAKLRSIKPMPEGLPPGQYPSGPLLGGPLPKAAMRPVPVTALPASKSYLWSRPGPVNLEYAAQLSRSNLLTTREKCDALDDPNSMSPELSKETQAQLIEVEKAFRNALAFGDKAQLLSLMKRMSKPLAPFGRTLWQHYQAILEDPRSHNAQVGLSDQDKADIQVDMEKFNRTLAIVSGAETGGKAGFEKAKAHLEAWTYEEAKRILRASGKPFHPSDLRLVREALRGQLGFAYSLDEAEAVRLNRAYTLNPGMWIPEWLNRTITSTPIVRHIQGTVNKAFGTGVNTGIGAFETGAEVESLVRILPEFIGEVADIDWDRVEQKLMDAKRVQASLEGEFPAAGMPGGELFRSLGRELPYLLASVGAGHALKASTAWQAFAKLHPTVAARLGPAAMSSISSLPRFPGQVIDRVMQGQDYDQAFIGALIEQASEIGVETLFGQTGVEGILRDRRVQEVVKLGVIGNITRNVPGMVIEEAFMEGMSEVASEGLQIFGETFENILRETGDPAAALVDAITAIGTDEAFKRYALAGKLGATLGGGVTAVSSAIESAAEARGAQRIDRDIKNLQAEAISREALQRLGPEKAPSIYGAATEAAGEQGLGGAAAEILAVERAVEALQVAPAAAPPGEAVPGTEFEVEEEPLTMERAAEAVEREDVQAAERRAEAKAREETEASEWLERAEAEVPELSEVSPEDEAAEDRAIQALAEGLLKLPEEGAEGLQQRVDVLLDRGDTSVRHVLTALNQWQQILTTKKGKRKDGLTANQRREMAKALVNLETNLTKAKEAPSGEAEVGKAGKVSPEPGIAPEPEAAGEAEVGTPVGRRPGKGRQVAARPAEGRVAEAAPTPGGAVAPAKRKGPKRPILTKEVKAKLKSLGYRPRHVGSLSDTDIRQILDLNIPLAEYAAARKTGKGVTPTEQQAIEAKFQAAQEARRGETAGAAVAAAQVETTKISPAQVEAEKGMLATEISRALGLREQRGRAVIRDNPSGSGVLVTGAKGASVVVRTGTEADLAAARAAAKAHHVRLAPGEKPAGFYDPTTNEIVIFSDAKRDFTINHELIHFFEESGLLLPAETEALLAAAEEAVYQDGTKLSDRIRAQYPKNVYPREMIAHYIEGTKAGEFKVKDRTIIDKVLDFLRNLARYIGFGPTRKQVVEKVLRGEPIARKPAQQFADRFAAVKTQTDPSPEATESVAATLGDETGNATRDLAEANQLSEDNVSRYLAGDVVHSPLRFSIHQRSAARAAALAYLRDNGVDETRISEIMQGWDEMEMILDGLAVGDVDLFPRGAGVAARGPIRANSDPLYVYSFDLTASCIRRLAMAATVREISARLKGRPLTVDELVAVNMVLRARNKLAPCLECYVETVRRKMSEQLNKWRDWLNGTVQPVVNKASKTGVKDIQAFISAANRAGMTGNDIDFDALLDPAHSSQKPNPLLTMPNGDQVYFQDYVKSMASSKANLVKLYEEYVSQVFDIPQKDADYLNKRAGLRFLSSSDFQSEHATDFVQALFHCSMRELRAHVYTKIESLVQLIGNTGVKVNMSIFANTVNGEVVPDRKAGFDWDKAKQYREKFPDAGTVFIAKDDVQLRWALDNASCLGGWIDYIIPYHLSGMPKEYADQLRWVDYTCKQKEKWKTFTDPKSAPAALRRRLKKSGNKFVVDPARLPRRLQQFLSESVDLASGVAIEKRKGYVVAAGDSVVPKAFRAKAEAARWLKTSTYANVQVKRKGKMLTYQVVEAPVYEVTRAGKPVTDPFVSKARASKWAKGQSELSVRHYKPNIPTAAIYTQQGLTDQEAKPRYLDLCEQLGVVPVFNDWIDHEAYAILRKDYARTDTPFNPVNTKFDFNVFKQLTEQYVEEFRPTGGRQPQADQETVDQVVKMIENRRPGESLAIPLLQADVQNAVEQSLGGTPDAFSGTSIGTTNFAQRWRKIARMPGRKPSGETVFRSPVFRRFAGRRNLDIGGADVVMPEGTVNLVYSPTMTEGHNQSLIESTIRDPVHTVTIRGHLDGVAPQTRSQLIKQAAAIIEHDGAAFFYTNRPVDLMQEVGQWFSVVERHGNIVAGMQPVQDTATLLFSLPDGRPNYANPNYNQDPALRTAHDDVYEAIRDVKPLQQETVDGWEKEADRRLATVEGRRMEEARLLQMTEGYYDPATGAVKTLGLGPVDMVMVRKLVDRLYVESQRGDRQAFTRYVAMANAYLNAGSQAARGMRARHDTMYGPDARLSLFRRVVAEMPSQMRKELDFARLRKDKAGVQRIQKAWESKVQMILFALDKRGLDFSDLAAGEKLMNNDFALMRMRDIQAMKRTGWQSFGDMVTEYYYASILSGVKTHVRNTLGNLVMGAWEFTAQRWAEAMVNTVAGLIPRVKADGTTFGELVHVYKALCLALPPACKNAFRSFLAQEDVLEADVLGVENELKGDKVERRGKSIPGPVGTVLRTSLAALSAEDSFFKTIFAQATVASLAYRYAKQSGKAGEELTGYIAGVLADMSHPIWQEALATAKELTFQTPLPDEMEQAVEWLRSLGEGFLPISPGVLFIPFVRVPYNIYRLALNATPLGTIGIAVNLLRRKSVGYTGQKFRKDLARQLLAWPMMLAIQAMLNGEDDDDDTRPVLTGAVQDPRYKAFREFQYRFAPPMSFRWGDEWRTYAGLDPVSTAIATMVDLIHTTEMQANPPQKLGYMLSRLIDQAQDKTFLRGVADMLTFFRDPAFAAERMAVNVPVAFVPNLFRQVITGQRDYIDDFKMQPVTTDEAWTEMYWRIVKARAEVYPWTWKPHPLVDLWGRDVLRYNKAHGTALWKLWNSTLNPFVARQDTATQWDYLIHRWNEIGDEEWYPSQVGRSLRLPAGPGEEPKTRSLTHDEFYAYQKLAGRYALELMDLAQPNWKQPTAVDVKIVTQIINDARERARGELFYGKEPMSRAALVELAAQLKGK